MKTDYLNRFKKQIAVLSGVIGISAFAGVPALAQAPATMPESSTGAGYNQENMMDGTNPGAQQTREQMMNRTTAGAESNIVEVAAGSESFDTLVQAVQAAELEGTLASGGPYTVFAPTDEAFAELPNGTLEYLLRPENRGLLRQVLSYHVVPGEVTSNEIQTGSVDTLAGGIAVRVAEDRVIVNNGSVVQPDIQASNGVIHAVNRVLLPRELRNTLISQVTTQQ
ncbi:MAG: fasciclin domain-containing protein [Kastovskya adunca ATA6-11-RM4]|jgi:uncharacterized surface protein with fasciclin (FAS1) repeats|nr:fasciclin domain-containing protein [Kastovskya adunca ATA6-11-RM4]